MYIRFSSKFPVKTDLLVFLDSLKEELCLKKVTHLVFLVQACLGPHWRFHSLTATLPMWKKMFFPLLLCEKPQKQCASRPHAKYRTGLYTMYSQICTGPDPKLRKIDGKSPTDADGIWPKPKVSAPKSRAGFFVSSLSYSNHRCCLQQ